MIYSIYKCVKTAIIEVIYHTTHCIMRDMRRRWCVETIVVRASMSMWWGHYIVSMRGMRIGMIARRRRSVVVILRMRLAMMIPMIVMIVIRVVSGGIMMPVVPATSTIVLVAMMMRTRRMV